MSAPTTAQEIYDLLVGDDAISDELGVYTLASGTTLPAISVMARGDSLPSGTVTSGLEVVITASPNQAEELLLTDEVLTNPTWRIYVIAWGTLGQLQAVRNRIVALLPGAVSSQLQCSQSSGGLDAAGEGLGVMEQVVIRWTNPAVVVEAGA
jgi:hypothetical protein